METKFYGKALYDNYASVIEQPALLMQNIKLIFENEKKIQQRIDRHTSIMLDYKKQKDKVKAKEMNDSIKFNIGELKTVEALRKKHGRLSVYFRNIKKFGGNVIFGLFLSVLSWYLIIAETFIGLFPPLSKIYEQNESKPTKS